MLCFLKSKCNSVSVLDPAEPEIDHTHFAAENCSTSPCVPYKEDNPSNTPEPRGIGFTVRDFVESEHAGDSVTRLLRTVFTVFLNSDPVFDHSKSQGSCETSSFGSEFIAMKHGCKHLRGLR